MLYGNVLAFQNGLKFNLVSADAAPACMLSYSVRDNIHLGGQTEFCPNGFGGGEGGGSSRNFPSSVFSGGGGGSSRNFPWSIFSRAEGSSAGFPSSPESGTVFPLTAVTDPSIRVIQTGFVFCPNNVDSLPELMSTNCPNWGGQLPPPAPARPVRLCMLLMYNRT